MRALAIVGVLAPWLVSGCALWADPTPAGSYEEVTVLPGAPVISGPFDDYPFDSDYYAPGPEPYTEPDPYIEPGSYIEPGADPGVDEGNTWEDEAEAPEMLERGLQRSQAVPGAPAAR